MPTGCVTGVCYVGIMEQTPKSDRNGAAPRVDADGRGPDVGSRAFHAASGASGTPSEDGSGAPSKAVETACLALARLSLDNLSLRDCESLARDLGRLRSRVDSLLCDVGRWVTDLDPDIDAGEVLRQAARISARDAEETVRIGEQLRAMPNVSDRFSSGDMTFRHAAALTKAAAQVGAEEVDSTTELIDLASVLPADTFRRRVGVWTTRTIMETGADPLEMQRRARRGVKWSRWSDGMKIFRVELDAMSGTLMEQALDSRYRALLMKDSAGGRDPDDVRTPVQRMADAYFEVMTHRDALTREPLPVSEAQNLGPVAKLLVKVDIAELDGVGATGQVDVIGAGPVPRRILETLSPDTELVATIFSGEGRALWMGRKIRLGNAAQRLAVAVRDGGCFECGAPMYRCQLHHIREWKRGGPTDIDNLVAVCPRHHRWITDRNLGVERTADGWRAIPRDGPGRAAA